jgi:hypothetical protein
MAKESEFVAIAEAAAKKILPSPPLSVRGHAVLLYQVTLDNELKLIPPVDQLPRPKRGQSAFQTDLCVFEDKQTDSEGGKTTVSIPRVVMEFKGRITTHDVLTYSAKARKHKQVYPYLRYGIICSEEAFIPGRVFTHNEALDFCAAIKGYRDERLDEFLKEFLEAEVESSRRLEEIGFGHAQAYLFRTEVIVKKVGSGIS